MRRFRFFQALAVVCILSLAALAHAAPIVIKFSHVVAEDTPKGQMAVKLKELVDAKLAG